MQNLQIFNSFEHHGRCWCLLCITAGGTHEVSLVVSVVHFVNKYMTLTPPWYSIRLSSKALLSLQMPLEFAVRMLQNYFIPRAFSTSLVIILVILILVAALVKGVILLIFSFFGTATIGFDKFTANERFKHQETFAMNCICPKVANLPLISLPFITSHNSINSPKSIASVSDNLRSLMLGV